MVLPISVLTTTNELNVPKMVDNFKKSLYRKIIADSAFYTLG